MRSLTRLFCTIAAIILLTKTAAAQTPGQPVSAPSAPAAASITPSASTKVTVIEIANEVDLGMASYVDRAVREAETNHSVLVLHVNTLGGRLDAATKIRDRILGAQVPLSIAFIDSRAISAGALISLAAQKIYMTSGATLGAATPVYSSGEKATEKVVSYMTAEMRTTAERNHRDPKIAAAMVDESLGLDSSYKISVPKGKLLTLTTDDALKVGYSDAKAESITQALTLAGVSNPTIIRTTEGYGESAVRFLTSGIVSALLIMIGMGGIFYSIKTGHFGFITLTAIGALVLFFGAQYIVAIAPLLAVILFLAGLTLMLIEVSPVPTFGLAGILGIAGLIIGLFLALAGDPAKLTPDRLSATLTTLAVALVGVIVLVVLIVKYAPRSTWLNKFRNTTTTADTQFYAIEEAELIGRRGIAQTMLRPAGTVLVGEKKVDAVTAGEFISPGTEVQIVHMSGNRVVVQAIDEIVMTQEDQHAPDHGDGFGGRLPRSS